MGRPLPQWEGCETLGPGEFFLMMADVSDSFDGRYFGVTERRGIIGRLVPLWTR
jgi:type IV secretory pathway protease TraF